MKSAISALFKAVTGQQSKAKVLQTKDLLLLWTYDFMVDARECAQWTTNLLLHVSCLIGPLPHDSLWTAIPILSLTLKMVTLTYDSTWKFAIMFVSLN